MTKYTFYIVTNDRDHHYPVLMANNGKAALNESVERAGKFEKSIRRFLAAAANGEVAVVRITHAEFRRKFPKFAKNSGGRKKAAPKKEAAK